MVESKGIQELEFRIEDGILIYPNGSCHPASEEEIQMWNLILELYQQKEEEKVVQKGFVITENGIILVQLPDDNPHGFVLASDDQTWPGGNGVAESWEMIPADDPRITKADHERLDWLLKD